MCEEELYLIGQLVSYCQEHGYAGGVIPSDLASKTRIKRYIKTRWIVDAKSK